MGKRNKVRKRKRDSSSCSSDSCETTDRVDLKTLQKRILKLEKERDREKRRHKSKHRSPLRSRSRSRSRRRRSPSFSVARRKRQNSILSNGERNMREQHQVSRSRSTSRPRSDYGGDMNRTGLEATGRRNDIQYQACSLTSEVDLDACSVHSSKGKSDDELLIHNDEELPEEVLEILGDNPEKTPDTRFSLHAELVPRWRRNLLNGMQKDEANILFNKYEIPSNLSDLTPPKLNPEITTIMRKKIILLRSGTHLRQKYKTN